MWCGIKTRQLVPYILSLGVALHWAQVFSAPGERQSAGSLARKALTCQRRKIIHHA